MTTETKSDLQSSSVAGISLLGKVLRADGAFASFSGLILILGAKGPPKKGKIIFGNVEQAGAKLAIVLNILWVIVSYAGILFGWFPVNSAGKWAIALIAEAVFIFAVIEFITLRRATREVVG